MVYTLNQYNIICQLHLNETGGVEEQVERREHSITNQAFDLGHQCGAGCSEYPPVQPGDKIFCSVIQNCFDQLDIYSKKPASK